MKKILIVLAIITILIIGLWAWQSSQKSPVAKIGNRTFNLYLTKTNEDKQIGLSKYDKIDDSKAMIFSFEKPDYYSFWMKEMKFPIDIIYVRDDKIVTIHKNVQPPKNDKDLQVYSSNKPADTVIEVNAGLSQKYNIKEGDSVKVSNI